MGLGTDEFYCRSCAEVKNKRSMSPERKNCCGSCHEGMKKRLGRNKSTQRRMHEHAQAEYLAGKGFIIERYGKK